MLHSQARVPTAHAARYMAQLAKHWSHKFDVALEGERATFPLPMGMCRMTAEEAALDITLEAEDPESMARLKGVVANHVQRFAFREPDLAFDWG